MARRWLLLLCLLSLPLFFTGLCARGFTDNEARYAEVGREILTSGDWITTRINGEPLLTKPPLLCWLSALVLRVGGLNELPRLISGLATLATLILLFDLGRRLWPEQPSAGTWAAAVFLSSALTPLEARILRPDTLLTFFLCLTFWGVVRVNRRPERADALGVLAVWGGVGLAVMTKGLIGLLLPALILLPTYCLARERISFRRYAPWWGLLLAALLILPWHLAVGRANPGFWWDYVVNQHLLFFLDRKFPRDCTPHPLWLAWAAFAGRLMPWLLLLPAAVAAQIRWARAEQTLTAYLPLTWLGMVWLFFSLSKGRLEYYFLPAVPAAALLTGSLCSRWCADEATGIRYSAFGVRNGRGRIPNTEYRIPNVLRWRLLPFLLLVLLGGAGMAVAPGLLRHSGVLTMAPPLLPVAQSAFLTVVMGGAAGLLLGAARRLSLGLGALVAAFLLFGWYAGRGMDAVGELNSVRPVIERLDPELLAQSTLAYEAEEEYQRCAGLNFYLQRPVLILKPSGFIPPAYLEPHMRHLFVERGRFWNEWRQARKRYLLFTELHETPAASDTLPHRYYEVGRGFDRRVISHRRFPALTADEHGASGSRKPQDQDSCAHRPHQTGGGHRVRHGHFHGSRPREDGRPYPVMMIPHFSGAPPGEPDDRGAKTSE